VKLSAGRLSNLPCKHSSTIHRAAESGVQSPAIRPHSILSFGRPARLGAVCTLTAGRWRGGQGPASAGRCALGNSQEDQSWSSVSSGREPLLAVQLAGEKNWVDIHVTRLRQWCTRRIQTIVSIPTPAVPASTACTSTSAPPLKGYGSPSCAPHLRPVKDGRHAPSSCTRPGCSQPQERPRPES
jgi:hypothetical protein